MQTNSLQEFKDFMLKSVNKENITNNYLKNLSVFLRTREHTLNISTTSDALNISITMLNNSLKKNNLTFIDLKPYFKNSNKAKQSKNGGWYLKIPVGGVHKVRDYRDVYGRDIWDKEISKMDFNSTFQGQGNLPSQLQSKLQQGNVIPELEYQWKSSSITRVQKGSSGTRGSYLTFRTVSNKSDPMSWIVGRNNLSNQIQENNSHNERQLASYISQVINAYVNSYNKLETD